MYSHLYMPERMERCRQMLAEAEQLRLIRGLSARVPLVRSLAGGLGTVLVTVGIALQHFSQIQPAAQ